MVASAFLVRFTICAAETRSVSEGRLRSNGERSETAARPRESAEIYGKSRRSSPTKTQPSKPQNHAADYTRFSPLALGKWKSGKVEEWKSSATHFSTIQLFYYSTRAKRVGRAFGLKERSGTALLAARCLSSRTFRNTLSTPSAADSEFSPVITERALGSHLKPRGRKFADLPK